MALIKFELSPAWKRVSDDEGEETDVEETTEETAERIEIVDENAVEEASAPKRRLLTLRRVLGLGIVVGAVIAARRMRKGSSVAFEDASEEPTIDVEATDEPAAE